MKQRGKCGTHGPRNGFLLVTNINQCTPTANELAHYRRILSATRVILMPTDDRIERYDPDATDNTDAWVRNAVRERRLDDLWTARQHIIDDATREGHDPVRVGKILEAMDANGDILVWSGHIAPADPDRLREVIEAELESSFGRRLLIGKCNRLIADARSTADINESSDDTGGDDS